MRKHNETGSKTHRCIDCPHAVEHTPQETCGCCGRCATHCVQQPKTFAGYNPITGQQLFVGCSQSED